jgi:hypothetical protein
MTFIAAGAMVVSSLIGADAASSSARTQARAADRAAQLQKEQFERQVELQTPFREAGVRALPELETASRYTPFGMQQFTADPGYGFRLAEGQKALDRQAAARGGLISGGALRAAQRYGQEMGSQEYTNAFNRYQTERQARLNPLQSLAGMAQTSVGQLGQAGQAMATGVGEAGGQAAQARASGYMGGANALSQGLGQYINYSQGQDRNALFQQMLNRPASVSGGGGGAAVGYQDPYAGFSYGSNA